MRRRARLLDEHALNLIGSIPTGLGLGATPGQGMDCRQVQVRRGKIRIEQQHQPVPARRLLVLVLHEVAGGHFTQVDGRPGALPAGVFVQGLGRDQMRECTQGVAARLLAQRQGPVQARLQRCRFQRTLQSRACLLLRCDLRTHSESARASRSLRQ